MGIFSGQYMRSNAPRSATRVHCFAKRRLSDPTWEYLPFLECNSFNHDAAPSIGQATFTAHFGIQMKGSHGLNYWDFYYPFIIRGAFILIAGQNSFYNSGSVLPMGIYQISNENISQFSTGNGYPSGSQSFNGLEMSGVLDRMEINYSVVVNNDNVRMRITDMIIFNENLKTSNNTTGNRSSVKSGGAYFFDLKPNNGQSAWSNYDILEYLFVHFINKDNLVPWGIDGDGADVLKNIFTIIDFTNKTVWQVLDELINKNYGLGFGVRWNNNIPYIYITSKYPPGTFGNSSRGIYRTVNLDNRGLIDNSLSFDEGAVFDSIEIIGGPVYTTGTFSFYNNTLEENWNINDEYEYVTLPGTYPEVTLDEMNEEREKEKYSNIYNNFRLPRNWNGVIFSSTLPGDTTGTTTITFPNGFNYFPSIDPISGFLDFTYYVTPYFWGSTFEPKLPFINFNNENMDAFVGIAADKADIDNLSGTDIKYFKINNLGNIELNSGTLEFNENEFSFKTDIVPNYTLGKNRIVINDGTSGATWSGDGSTQIDMTLLDADQLKLKYNNIFITATIDTGNKLNLIRNARTNYETIRKKTINMGDNFNLHLVSPRTIVDIKPNYENVNYGDLQYFDEPFYVKNDMNKIRNIMFLALSVYSIPRAVCTFTAADALPSFGIGDYIYADVGKSGTTFINQNISSISRTITSSGVQTNVVTSFEPIDEVSIFENMLDYKFKQLNKEYAVGTDGYKKIIKPKNGTSVSKPIRRVDDFPDIPKTKSEIIFLTKKNTTQQNSQKWASSPGDSRWHPMEKFVTIQGLPHELLGE